MKLMTIGTCYLFFTFAFSSTGLSQSTTSNMVLIPAGDFIMGKNTGGESSCSPAHQVSLNSFYMDTCEVSNRQYLEFCKASNYKLPAFWNTELFRSGEAFPSHPVVGISHQDAKAYAEWAGKRLPTEAEWEYAARGGLVKKDYPNGNKWTKQPVKHQPGQWLNQIEAVGQTKPNGYGLYDMAGNVWEWTSDNFDLDYFKHSPKDNPTGPDRGCGKVIKGGGWYSGAMCKKVYGKKGLPSNWCDFALGFRCVKSADKP